jgi:hypothetical protein
MMNTEENLEPVWDIFSRIEKTEKVSKELKKRTKELQREVKDVKPTLEQLFELQGRIVGLLGDISTQTIDVDTIAMEAYLWAFLALAIQRPDLARVTKDRMISSLKSQKLSAKKLGMLEHVLLLLCDEADKQWSN